MSHPLHRARMGRERAILCLCRLACIYVARRDMDAACKVMQRASVLRAAR